MQKQTIGREAKFLKSLYAGSVVSRAQATSRYSLLNPSAAILRFEQAGVKINREYVLRKADGHRIVKYSIQAKSTKSKAKKTSL